MREEDLTLALERHLRAQGWRVLTRHHPGAQGGVSVLRTPRPRPPTKGAFLLVESKTRYSRADAAELAALIGDPAYRCSLRERFGTQRLVRSRLLVALALPEPHACLRTSPAGRP